MADFQKTVNAEAGAGLAGAFASMNPVASTAVTYIAGSDVPFGAFVWATGDGKAEVKGSGKPSAIAHLDRIYTIASVKTGAQDFIPAGAPIDGMTAGDFFVNVAEAVTAGKKVFAKTADGTAVAGDAGGTVSGAVETNFVFVTDAAAGDVAVISGHI